MLGEPLGVQVPAPGPDARHRLAAFRRGPSPRPIPCSRLTQPAAPSTACSAVLRRILRGGVPGSASRLPRSAPTLSNMCPKRWREPTCGCVPHRRCKTLPPYLTLTGRSPQSRLRCRGLMRMPSALARCRRANRSFQPRFRDRPPAHITPARPETAPSHERLPALDAISAVSPTPWIALPHRKKNENSPRRRYRDRRRIKPTCTNTSKAPLDVAGPGPARPQCVERLPL